MRPRLTIGIPTFKRDPFDHLQYAVDSCLQQTIPVKIVVADQGHTDAVARYMARYRDHPNVRHVLTDAKILWDNWTAASKACDTEFFAWLQDDDTIQPPYADRVCRAFDAFPDALHWQAFCYVTPDRIHALRWAWNGPQVGVNMRYNLAEKWHGEYCVAAMYLMSWSLSPGVAFRCGQAFTDSVAAIPGDCDLHNERLILAEMGSRGDWIADGLHAGSWNHHGQNESYRQNQDGSIEQQDKSLVQSLDAILDRLPSWKHGFHAWLILRSAQEVMTWIKDAFREGSKHPLQISRHSADLKAVMFGSLEGRIEGVQARELAVGVDSSTLIFDPANPDTIDVAA